MDWVFVLAAVLYFVAVSIVAVRERSEDWDLRRHAGSALFLLGVGLTLFMDDAVAIFDTGGPALSAWSELIGVVVMLPSGCSSGPVRTWPSPGPEPKPAAGVSVADGYDA